MIEEFLMYNHSLIYKFMIIANHYIYLSKDHYKVNLSILPLLEFIYPSQ